MAAPAAPQWAKADDTIDLSAGGRFDPKNVKLYMQTVLLFYLDYLARIGHLAAGAAWRKLCRQVPDVLRRGFLDCRHGMVYALADSTSLWEIGHWIAPFVLTRGLPASLPVCDGRAHVVDESVHRSCLLE